SAPRQCAATGCAGDCDCGRSRAIASSAVLQDASSWLRAALVDAAPGQAAHQHDGAQGDQQYGPAVSHQRGRQQAAVLREEHCAQCNQDGRSDQPLAATALLHRALLSCGPAHRRYCGASSHVPVSTYSATDSSDFTRTPAGTKVACDEWKADGPQRDDGA